LQPPKQDSLGFPIECGEDGLCSLHLVIDSNDDSYPPQYLRSLGPLALVIAVGNIGRHLENRKEYLNTYLSRDGGMNWQEIFKGPHLYFIGFRGYLILVCPKNKPITFVHYSLDEGHTWQIREISVNPIFVQRIQASGANEQRNHIILVGIQEST